MKIKLLLVFLMPLLSSQCPGRKTPNEDNSPLVQLETSACFGYCPVYRLTVRNNGWTEYLGIRNVVKMGLDSFRLTGDELSGLREKVKAANLWQYPDRIPTQVADAPYSTLRVWRDTSSKSVTGTVDRPKPLLELEAQIKSLATAHGLEVKNGVNPNRPPATNRPELLVQFKPDANAGNVMGQITELDVRLVRRTGPENIWVVSYDPAQIAQKDLIRLLKDLDGVLEAQENAKAKDRD